MANKIELAGRALEEAYPVLVKRYSALMERIGIRNAPSLHVNSTPSHPSPAVGHLPGGVIMLWGKNEALEALIKKGIKSPGKIEIVPGLAEMAHTEQAPLLDAVVGHEMGHILTGKSSLLRTPGTASYKDMELEMDRFGALIAGSHDAMIDARRWAHGPGSEQFRPSNLRTTTSLVGKGCQMLERWIETKGYDLAQGSPSTIVSNIRRVNLNDRSMLEPLVEKHNKLTENWAELVKLQPSMLQR